MIAVHLAFRAVAGLVLAAALLVPDPSVGQEAGGLGIRLVEAPVDRADDPRAQSYIVDHVAPGATIERRIEVSNTSSQPIEVQLYPVAAIVEGEAFRPDAGRVRNELADWTSVDPSSLALQPGDRAEAVVRIVVPPDASAGERYAAVLAERPPPTDVPPGEVGIAARVGIRVYLSVGAGGEPPSDFTVDTLTAARLADGAPVVRASMTNTGGRALDLSGELTLLDGPGGLTAGPFTVPLGTTLAPGDTAVLEVPLDPALPPGPWLGRLAMRSGQLERTAEATITFPDEPETSATAVDAQAVSDDEDGASESDSAGGAGGTGGRTQLLIVASLLVALILLALAVWSWRFRRYRRRRAVATPASPEV